MQLVLEQSLNSDVVCLFGYNREEVCQEESLKKKSLIFFTPNKGLVSSSNSPFIYEIEYNGVYCDLGSFQEICKEKIFLSFVYVVHPIARETANLWVEKCQTIQWQCHLAASDCQDFGLQVFENTVKNSRRSIDTSSFDKLKDSLRGLPAFVCGAGPSLNKSMEALKSLSGQGVIFAGGASLGYLTKAMVPVHIAAGIDPDPSYERTLMQGSFEIPFFYQSRFSSSLLETIHGPLFQVPGNPGYKLEQWMNAGSMFDGGWTVSTFSIALAIHFGCSPIVFVGIDLSYPVDSTAYAGGVVKKEKGIEWTDPLSGSVMTQKDWVLASRWIEEKVERSPSTCFYSTSDKGLSLKGVGKISLQTLLDRVLLKKYDVEGFMRVLSSHWEASQEMEGKLDLLQKSLENTLVFIGKLLRMYEKNYPEDPSSKGEFVVNLFDLYDEIFYQEVLEPLWEVWQFPIERKLQDSYSKDINRLLFFEKIIREYGNRLWK